MRSYVIPLGQGAILQVYEIKTLKVLLKICKN